MREPTVNPESRHPLLAELPVFAPETDLWPRIRGAHEAKRRARTTRWIGGIAAAAAVAVVGVSMLTRHAPDTMPMLAGQEESQTLEREWRTLPTANARPASGLARLYMIDAALQAAYDRGAAADELKPLWQQRNAALRGLIESSRAEAITRI